MEIGSWPHMHVEMDNHSPVDSSEQLIINHTVHHNIHTRVCMRQHKLAVPFSTRCHTDVHPCVRRNKRLEARRQKGFHRTLARSIRIALWIWWCSGSGRHLISSFHTEKKGRKASSYYMTKGNAHFSRQATQLSPTQPIHRLLTCFLCEENGKKKEMQRELIILQVNSLSLDTSAKINSRINIFFPVLLIASIEAYVETEKQFLSKKKLRNSFKLWKVNLKKVQSSDAKQESGVHNLLLVYLSHFPA